MTAAVRPTATAAAPAVGAPDGSAERVVAPAVCLGCGCACDDIEVVVRGGRIAEARRACPLGIAWFGDGRVPARALAGGHEAPVDAALDAAARLLVGARRPMVYLAPDLSCEAQRETIALADVLHAALDSVTTDTAMPSILAVQERGRASATLGEVRNRADVLVCWGVDPARRYPRYPTRYAPEPAGMFVPDGRRSRTVVAVDVGDSAGPADADVRVAVAPDDEVAVLTALRALADAAAAGTPLPAPDAPPEPGRDGPAWAAARRLAPHLHAAHYLAIVHDAEPVPNGSAPRDPGRATALVALAQALNGPTRCALSTLRAGGNRSGADAVLTSQTGYPAAVDFARGYPRYGPHDGAAARLARGAVDAVLVVGDVVGLPEAVGAALGTTACAVLGPRASEGAPPSAVAAVDTGVAGIHEGGVAFRMDDVPLPLRPALDDPALGAPPAAADVVRALRARVAPLVSRRTPTTPGSPQPDGHP